MHRPSQWCKLYRAFSLVNVSLFFTLFWTCAPISHGDHMFPEGEERIVSENDFTITCFSKKNHFLTYENITWKRSDIFSILQSDENIYNRVKIIYHQNETNYYSSITIFNASSKDTGYYRCGFIRSINNDNREQIDFSLQQYVYVYRHDDLVTMISDSRLTSYYGDGHFTIEPEITAHIPCRRTHPNVTVSLHFERNQPSDDISETFNEANQLSLRGSQWKFEPKRGLILTNPSLENTGYYVCRGRLNNNVTDAVFVLDVVDVELTTEGETGDIEEGSNVTLLCRFASYFDSPVWKYGSKELGPVKTIDTDNPPSDIQIPPTVIPEPQPLTLETRLQLFYLSRSSPNTYQCTVRLTHQVGQIDWGIDIPKEVSKTIFLRLASTDANEQNIFQKLSNSTLVVLTLSVSFTLIIIIVVLAIFVGYFSNLRGRTFPGAGKLLDGSKIPDTDRDEAKDEAYATPYDRQWEFPKHLLSLGEQLGTGNFGRVLKAEAVGITGLGGTVQTVAVKTVKSNSKAAYEELEALVAELKILIYLGPHPNIVNLLGACTKQITKGKLLVILEYCPFGNLKSILNNAGNSFINQLEIYDDTRSQDDEANTGQSGYMRMSSTIKRQSKHPQDLSPTESNNSLEVLNQNLNEEVVTHDPSSNSQQEMDDASSPMLTPWQFPKNPGGPLNLAYSTQDLIVWSWQVARGMKHLANKKVVHGDLAARNVLMADNGVIKVADFGLARKMYYKGLYQKEGSGPLPAKWMAIESLTNGTFTTQSDVWSYGVLLWELFSLGKIPYPGIANKELANELERGHRMGVPKHAPRFIGDLMKMCWKTEPRDRPSINELEEILFERLDSEVTSPYLKLDKTIASAETERLLN